MSRDLIPDANLDARDVRAAQAVLDAWLEDLEGEEHPGLTVPTSAALRLRGLLAAQFADVRAAGLLEGHERGRQRGHFEARQAVTEALEGL